MNRVGRLVFATLLALGTAAAQPANRPNILFCFADDWGRYASIYAKHETRPSPNQVVKTPNLDRLAARGVRFERAYCQFPLCNPSRTSLLTGRYPVTTGVMDNLKYFRDAAASTVTLPQAFRAAGYATARTGKIFHGGIDDLPSWEEGGEPGQQRPPRTPAQAGDYRRESDRWVAVEGEGEELPAGPGWLPA